MSEYYTPYQKRVRKVIAELQPKGYTADEIHIELHRRGIFDHRDRHRGWREREKALKARGKGNG